MSANAGDEIYNRVIVTGQTPAGEPLSVERTQGEQPGVAFAAIDTPTATNPSADTNTTGWSITGSGTITRTTTTGEFDTAPAGFKWTPGSLGSPLVGTFTGKFRAGTTYRLQFVAKTSAAGFPVFNVQFGVLGVDGASLRVAAGTTFTTYIVDWTPKTDRTGVTVQFLASDLATFFLDTFTLFKAAPTLVDRRSFRRTMTLPIGSALPSDGAAAAQIGDVWLAAHKTTPFRGSVTLTGDALRDVLTGDSVPLERLLLAPQALIRFSDRIDPDTGAHGRDGRIASVTYTPATDTASVTIDSSRSNFETLLSRLAIIGGG